MLEILDAILTCRSVEDSKLYFCKESSYDVGGILIFILKMGAGYQLQTDKLRFFLFGTNLEKRQKNVELKFW